MSITLFLDTEFTGLRQQATLISLALVSDDHRSFYAEFTDYDTEQVNEWVKAQVIDNLILDGINQTEGSNWHVKGNHLEISRALRKFLAQFNHSTNHEVQIWADCLAYDWVLFCELFGGAMHLPESIFYMPFDLVTLLKINNINPDISREEFVQESLENIPTKQAKHNALWDAHVLKLCYEKAMNR